MIQPCDLQGLPVTHAQVRTPPHVRTKLLLDIDIAILTLPFTLRRRDDVHSLVTYINYINCKCCIIIISFISHY